jgi:hypothetical protein
MNRLFELNNIVIKKASSKQGDGEKDFYYFTTRRDLRVATIVNSAF